MKKMTLWAVLILLVQTTVSAELGLQDMKNFQSQEWLVPTVSMPMRLIPAGSFIMGSPEEEIGRRKDEVRHSVTIARPFYMAVYECRQKEFYPVMMPEDYDFEAWKWWRGPIHDGAAYTYRFPKPEEGDINPICLTHPIEMVTWHRAMEFCRKLTEAEAQAGRLPEGYVYRLPTEAEWEYACRAGTSGPYGIDEDHTDPLVLKKYTYAGSGGQYTFGVGDTDSNRLPNPWGLYDMHGNVWEWCLDWYGPYSEVDQIDPTGPPQGEERVARGGCCAPWWEDDKEWLNEAVHPFLRSAARYSFDPDTDYMITLGFRVVLAPEVVDGGEDDPS